MNDTTISLRLKFILKAEWDTLIATCSTHTRPQPDIPQTALWGMRIRSYHIWM